MIYLEVFLVPELIVVEYRAVEARYCRYLLRETGRPLAWKGNAEAMTNICTTQSLIG